MFAAFAAIAGTTATAQAAVEPRPITSMSPANGAVIPVRPEGLGESSWSLRSIPELQNVWVFVTLTPATGTDGVHLSTTDLKQWCVLTPSVTDVGSYENHGCTDQYGLWTTVQRTYYWQIWAHKITPPQREYLSPIFTITVGSTTTPPLPLEGQQPASGPTTRRSAPTTHRSAPTTPRPKCAGTRATIGGRSTCLRSGARCYARYRKQYARHHYACVRRGGRYRLVRR